MANTKDGLENGPEALFVDNKEEAVSASLLAINKIEPNKEQPRKQFDVAALSALADSIREYGVLQPLVVRPLQDGVYQLVAGERRWRAAQMAGLSEVPVTIKALTDIQTMEIALVENLQRENLNPLEEARGFRDLMDKFGMTQEQVSDRVGKSRPVVTNTLRLLKLPKDVQRLVESGKVSTGHARALLSLEDDVGIRYLAMDIVRYGLSVRQVEKLIKKMKRNEPPQSQDPSFTVAWGNNFFTKMQSDLSQMLSRKVQVMVDGKENKGRLVIDFSNENDLEMLAEILKKGTE